MSAEDVRQFLLTASTALTVDAPKLERKVEGLLRFYEGIPSAVDVFEVLGLHGNENRHTNFFAWLLSPQEAHGLGDRLLRAFLRLSGDHRARRIARRASPLSAWVSTQLSFGKHGIPDLVIVVHGQPTMVVVVEAKIGAQLGFNEQQVAQTESYRQALEDEASLERLVLRPAGVATGEGSMPTERLYVFLTANPDVDPDPGHGDASEPEPEHRYRIITYRMLEAVLAGFVTDLEIAMAPRSLVQQFRTSILASCCGGASLLPDLEQLRLLRSSPGSGLPNHVRLERLRTAIQRFDAGGSDE